MARVLHKMDFIAIESSVMIDDLPFEYPSKLMCAMNDRRRPCQILKEVNPTGLQYT